MFRAIVVMVLGMLLAGHLATRAFASTQDVAATPDIVATTMSMSDGSQDHSAGSTQHASPCQDHCNGLTSLVRQPFQRVIGGDSPLPPRHLASLFPNVSVPPPQ